MYSIVHCILDFFVSFENMRISDPKTTFTNLKGCSIIEHPKKDHLIFKISCNH